MKDLSNLPTATLATMVHVVRTEFLTSIKLVLIILLFTSTKVNAQIQLSEINVAFAPNQNGGYALVNKQVLNPIKPIYNDSTVLHTWRSGETLFTMEFDIACQDCFANIIRYKQPLYEWRIWIILSNGKEYAEISSKKLTSK